MRTSKIVASIGIIIASLVLGCVGGFFLARMFGPNPTTKAQGQAINGGAGDVERRFYNMLENDINPAYASGSESNIVNTSDATNSQDNADNSKTYIDKYEHKFIVNLENSKVGDKFTELLTPDMKITIEVTEVTDYDRKWTISINDKAPAYTDESILGVGKIEFDYTNKLVTFTTHEGTDIRSSKFVAIDINGNLVKEIYEFDEDDKGLVFFDAKYVNNSLILTASRGYHGGLVSEKYGVSAPIDIDAKDIEKIKTNIVISALYIYKVNSDGSIDFNNPQVVNPFTFKEYLENYLNNATDETEFTTAASKWLNEHK